MGRLGKRKEHNTMTINQYLKGHRAELHRMIDVVCPNHPKTDQELRLWILNDEGLYNYVKSEGVRL